jgi:site-specific DNA recombinase
MRIIGYVRVSTAEQSYTQALSQQTQRLVTYGAEEIVSDIESGRKSDRPGFNRVLDLIETQGNFILVATRLDRLSRSIITTQKLYDLCDRRNVKIITLDDYVDTSTAAGKTQRDINAVFAAAESYRISERVKHGHAYHRQRRAAYFPIFGYVKNGDRLDLDRVPFLCCGVKEWSKAEMARELIDFLLTIGSLRGGLKAYNKKFGLIKKTGRREPDTLTVSVSGFATWISNPILRGHTAYGRTGKCSYRYESDWELVRNTHPSLISEAEWTEIRELLTINGKQKKYYGCSSSRPFLGLVRCDVCKGATTWQAYRKVTGEKKYSYQCSAYRQRGCSQKLSIREEKIRDAVIQKLTAHASEIFDLESGTETPNPEILKLEAQLSDLIKIPTPSPPILTAIAEIKSEIQQQLIKSQLEKTLESEGKQEFIRVFKNPIFWEESVEKELSPAEIRAYYRKWIKTIWIKEGEIVGIDLNF